MKFESIRSRHPDKETLLSWTEGELSWWRTRIVGRHVRSCWQCRGQASELETLVCAVGLGVTGLPEPSRVDTAKAYWRFREACLKIDEAPRRNGLQLKAAWVIVTVAILATTGLAYVTTHTRLKEDSGNRDSVLRPTRSLRPPDISATAPLAAVRGTIHPPVPQPVSEPATNQLPPSFSKPTEEELLSVEIQALAELHRLKLCVNSGITVHRANSSVVISGYVQSQDQQDHLSGVLQGIGRPEIIDVRLSYPSQNEEVVIGASPFPTASSARIAPPIESWLRENLRVGTRTSERELFNLMNAVVLESEQVSGEAWALRHLAQQFPPDRTRHLSPFLNEQLLKMVDGHTTALREGLQTLQSRIEPVLGGLPAESGHPLADSSRAPWQSRAVALQLRVEPAVNQVFDWFSVAGPVAPRANSQTMSGALAMLNSLQIEIRDCLAAAGKLKVVAQNREAANGLP